MRLLLALAIVALLGGVARAEDDEFDPTGWTELMSAKAGSWSRIKAKEAVPIDELAIVVTGVDVDLTSILVTFRGGRENLATPHRFEDGSRVLYLSLGRTVTPVTVLPKLGKLPKKTRGSITIYGRDSTLRTTSQDIGKTSRWWDEGWESFGRINAADTEALVNLSVWSDTPVTELTATVGGADLAISGLDVTFEDGTHWTTSDAYLFDDDAREHTFYLPAEPHVIRSIGFGYIVADGNTGVVSFYARDTTTPAADDDGPTWDDDGWTLIGEDEVDLVDDEVTIDRDGSTWDKVAIVAIGDDVTIEALEVHRAGKSDKLQRATIDERLTDGSRTRIIELTGKRRAIEKVRLQYKKHQLDGTTRVQVYAR